MQEEKKQKEEEDARQVENMKKYVPFPQRLQKKNEDKNFLKFLDVFKKLHINIPFADALAQMSSYAKFLKEILSKKR